MIIETSNIHKVVGKGNSQSNQKGAALLISMLLLIAITVLGLSNLAGSNTNEIISSNMQQRSIGFQASESAIKSVWNTDELLLNTPLVPLHNPPAVTQPRYTEYDQTKVDIEAQVSMQYCGEDNVLVGNSLSADESAPKLAAQIFDVHGLATIANSNVNTHHQQRGYLIRPVSGRQGNCPA